MNRIRATSRVLALVGDPVSHSLSPLMYNAAIAALGIDAVYVAIPTEASALPHVMRGFEAAGIAGNVTVPHKVAVANLLIRLTSEAKQLGAVNTFWSEGGRLVGDNTDLGGMLDTIDSLEADGPWILAGTGGAARAVAAAARERATTLLVQSRQKKRAAEFAAWARETIGVEALADDGRQAMTAINATPRGSSPNDPPPFSAERVEGCRSALDLVYAAGETRWVRVCRELGMRAADGRKMLVAQGARAFERFFPDQRAPSDIMAAAVERGLEP